MTKLQISSPSPPFQVAFWTPEIMGGGVGVCLKKILILHRDYHFTVFCPNTYHQVEQALKLTRQKRWNLLLC